jgi:DNA-binding transcriptional ArsR family regulator
MAYAEALFPALADPTRRRVFERLRAGGLSVGQIADGLPVSRPAVSQHLKVLKEAGLVVDEAQGARRVYHIDPQGLGRLRAWLDQFWAVALEAFKAEAEKDEGESE